MEYAIQDRVQVRTHRIDRDISPFSHIVAYALAIERLSENVLGQDNLLPDVALCQIQFCSAAFFGTVRVRLDAKRPVNLASRMSVAQL